MELEREEEITRVQYIKYERKDTIVRKIIEQKKREILYLEYKIGKRKK